MSDRRTLADLARVTTGFPFKSAQFTEDATAPRLLRGDNVQQGYLRWSNAARWPIGEEVPPDYGLAEGDVVLAMDRPWVDAGLKFASVSAADLPAYLVQRVARLRARSGTEQRYLHYLVASAAFTSHLLSEQTGTAIPHVSAAQIARFPVPGHSLDEQRAIAEVLGALDDKIAANLRVVHSMFDLSTAHYARARSRALETTALRELVTTQYGVTTSGVEGDGPRLIRVTDINKGPWIEWAKAPGCDIDHGTYEKYRLRAGDILVARMADPGKVAYVDDDADAVFASYLIRLVANDVRAQLYLYYFLQSAEYGRYANSVMGGSVQKNINAKKLVDTDAPVPTTDELAEFNAAVEPLRRAMRAHLVENQTLATTRDGLLPLLMSGKLRVKDAEKQIGEVG